MGVTDQAVAEYGESRVSPHPIKAMIKASRALLEWPNIPVTYVHASGTKVPTFGPFQRRLEANPRVDT